MNDAILSPIGATTPSTSRHPFSLARRAFAELIATAALVVAVLGSGIMAERLGGNHQAIVLLANTLVTVAALFVLIEIFAPVSGAHMNPVVTAISWFRRQLSIRESGIYMGAQLLGACFGAFLAQLMFDLPLLQWSGKLRSGPGIWLAEVVATSGLVLVVLRAPPHRIAACVAAYIGAAYWCTASTSFANPAATIGRMLSDSFAGIAPQSVPLFLIAQLIGGALGLALHQWLAEERSSIHPDRS